MCPIHRATVWRHVHSRVVACALYTGLRTLRHVHPQGTSAGWCDSATWGWQCGGMCAWVAVSVAAGASHGTCCCDMCTTHRGPAGCAACGCCMTRQWAPQQGARTQQAHLAGGVAGGASHVNTCADRVHCHMSTHVLTECIATLHGRCGGLCHMAWHGRCGGGIAHASGSHAQHMLGATHVCGWHSNACDTKGVWLAQQPA